MATTCSVRVIDKDTREPIQRALVIVFPGAPFGSKVRGTTDAEGRVVFYDGLPILNVKHFDFVAHAVGYYPDGLSGEFSQQSVEFDLVLEKVEWRRDLRQTRQQDVSRVQGPFLPSPGETGEFPISYAKELDPLRPLE